MDTDDVVYSTDGKTLLECKDKTIKNYTVNLDCMFIGPRAFIGCVHLSHVDLSNVEKIGTCSFSDCSSLREMSNLQNLNTIGDGAFMNCWCLQSIKLPEGLQSIGDSAFEGCDCLQEIILPSSILHLGHRTFADCANLKSVKIGNFTIISDAFEGCFRMQQIEK